MKKIVIGILLCVFIASNSIAQGLSSIGMSFNKLDKEDALIISPSVKSNFKNHTWSVGPTLLFSFGDQLEERESLKLTGISIGYENFPNGRNSKWNLFHSFDFIAQRIKDEQASQFFDTGSNSFVDNEIVQVDNNILLSANAGVLWNLGEKLSLSQTIGIGANIIFRDTKSDFDQFNDTFLNQQWSLQTGLRYKIN
ncbi:hypothetical protein [Ekhidna sp.]|uniref:hypothetical protein n=1 Tax=Ekhidna sp. TaxID=2608089 RepID=UPI003BAC235E